MSARVIGAYDLGAPRDPTPIAALAGFIYTDRISAFIWYDQRMYDLLDAAVGDHGERWQHPDGRWALWNADKAVLAVEETGPPPTLTELHLADLLGAVNSVVDALAVLAWCPATRSWLEESDPKALEQADAALARITATLHSATLSGITT